MKKILSLVLFAILVLAMGITAFAVSEDCVITVDGVEYTDFAEGWTAGLRATSNNENVVNIVLHADWTADEKGSFGSGHGFAKGAIYITEDTKDMCFDLNGYTIDRGLFDWNDINASIDISKKRESGEVINIEDGCDRITIRNGTIRGGCNNGFPGGGGVFSEDSNIVFENVTFTSNFGTYGGGLTLHGGKAEFKGCTFELNYSEVYGGAMYIADSDAVLRECRVNYNKTASKGGGIHINTWSDELKIYDCEFIGNQAWRGAAIDTLRGTVIENTEFSYNTATQYGGAINAEANELIKITNCSFFGNNGKHGGAIWSFSSTEIRSCEFDNNISTVDGCIRFNDDALVEDCTFRNNIGNGDSPSAIFVAARGEVTIKNSTITGNTGKCAVSISTGDGKNLGELWIDGTVIIDDNFNNKKQEMNLMLGEYGWLSTSVSMKKNFSKDSRIGISMDENDMENESAITDIPSGWTNEELAEVFTFDPYYGNGTSNSYYYLCRDGSDIIFKKGDPEDDKNAVFREEDRNTPVIIPNMTPDILYENPEGEMVGPGETENESGAGTIIGEGSVIMIAVLAVIAAAGIVMVIRKRKTR